MSHSQVSMCTSAVQREMCVHVRCNARSVQTSWSVRCALRCRCRPLTSSLGTRARRSCVMIRTRPRRCSAVASAARRRLTSTLVISVYPAVVRAVDLTQYSASLPQHIANQNFTRTATASKAPDSAQRGSWLQAGSQASKHPAGVPATTHGTIADRPTVMSYVHMPPRACTCAAAAVGRQQADDHDVHWGIVQRQPRGTAAHHCRLRMSTPSENAK